MMIRMKFTLMILFLLLIPSLVSAAVTVSITQSGADPGSVIAERTFTISGSNLDENCNSATIDLSECGVCSISENETKTISGPSVSWTTLTASEADSQKITVSISGTCEPDSGYVTFDAKTAPSLTVSVDPTSTSVTQGSTFSLSLNIQNNGETTANFGSITVSPSYFSISSGCSPSNILGGQSSGLSCTIAASSSAPAGSRTLSILISPTNADSVTKTASVTVIAGATTTTLGGGGGGGGGPSGPAEKKKTHTWTMITPGVVEIMHVNDPDIGLKQISINVRNRANNVKITVTKLVGKPASVVHNISGKVFKYMEINAVNLVDENISEAKIQFPVNKSWIIRNNINRATVALNRYHNNVWERLQTREISEDSDYVYYEAISAGFTTFAITGEEVTVTTTVAPVATTTTIPVTTTVPVIPSEVGGIPVWIVGLVIVIVVVAVIAFWIYRNRQETPLPVETELPPAEELSY